MSVTSVIARLYPVMLSLATISVGLGLYATDAFVFAVLMWISGGLVLIGMLSQVAPELIPRLEDTQEMSRRHSR